MDWKVSVSSAAALLLASVTAHAATPVDAYKVDASFLQGKHSIHLKNPGSTLPNSKARAAATATLHNALANATFGSGIPGVDTLVNFTGSFTAPGLDPSGTILENNWVYAMVGRAPSHHETEGGIRAPIFPVTVELLDANGNQAYDPTSGAALISDPSDKVPLVLGSPVFSPGHFSGSGDATQYGDAFMRTQFSHDIGEDWHVLLEPRTQKGVTMQVPLGAYEYALNADGSCCAFVLVDANTFGALLFPGVVVDNSTLIGAAELSGAMTTRTIASFLFPDTYLYEGGDPNNCCVLGYHTFDFESGTTQNGNLPRFYVMNYSSWVSPGLFGTPALAFQDVIALSHEMAETFDDPFVVFDGVHDLSPWWLSGSQCQDDIEVGDVVESLPANVTFAITMRNGYTYHPSNVALLQWFEFQSPSSARHGAYSFPDPAALPALSPQIQPVYDSFGNLINCVPTTLGN